MIHIHTSAHVRRAGLVLSHVLIFVLIPFARASVFITYPYAGISCSGGEECAVTWADDGQTPLLAAVGPSDFALFQGTNTLVQQLATGLDVSQTRELTFVPNAIAGPDSNAYWIKLTSVSARDPNNTSQPYTSFSGFFSLVNMSGVEGSPVASLTSLLPSSTSPVQGSASRSETNGVVGTTTLSNVIPSESASALSSALSAISSAASGSLGSTSSSRSVTSAASASSATNTGSASGTDKGSNSSGTSNTSFARGKGKELVDAYKISATLIVILLGTQTSVLSLL